MRAAQAELARAGLWTELSSAAGLAGLRSVGEIDGPVVCVSTSSGFKDRSVAAQPPAHTTLIVEPEWEPVRRALRAAGIRE
ncbi:hypothetical protein GCM10023317_34240 [Actinopolymorpha pittospori]|uniref:Threonine synthase n=1 Tax=Actinopolymorpha pittospori TaxID=648752 RepID=A0A927RFL8_9ACTN|nr:threonine synthase [Actinopolymorpha pittospori]